MADNIIRHMVAALATLITIFAYFAGYVSGGNGWWWTVFGCLIVYGGVYKIIDK